MCVCAGAERPEVRNVISLITKWLVALVCVQAQSDQEALEMKKALKAAKQRFLELEDGLDEAIITEVFRLVDGKVGYH
jgi:hypothetical protein